MKNIIRVLGISAALGLMPGCNKERVEPVQIATVTQQTDTATLYVMIDCKPCTPAQDEYKSATIDIREIKVFNTEHGWETLIPIQGAWDVISLQAAIVPVAEITEDTKVHSGIITQMTLTFGDNNKLHVNNKAASCFKLGEKNVTIDLHAEIKAGALNEIVLDVDICGKFEVINRYQEEPCYTLTPVFTFQSIIQR